MRLLLLRHGETISNIAQIYQGQGDGELSNEGKKQAQQTASFLADTKMTAVYCSDLKRSQDTAQTIAALQNLKVNVTPALRERYYGDWEGLKFGYIQRKYRSLYKLWLVEPDRANIPKAEKLIDLQKRGVSAISKIVKKHKTGTVLVVGHGGLNRTILFYYLGMDLNGFWKIRQNNCCINIVDFGRPYPKVELINSISHLNKHHFAKQNVLA